MNTILQKRIEEDAKKAQTNFLNRFNWSGTIETGFKKGAIWMLCNQWISVDESLPPCHDDDVISDVSIGVIARTSEGVIRYAYYHHYLKQWFSVETSIKIDRVTHWMFIPTEGWEE